MEWLAWTVLVLGGLNLLNKRVQRARIVWLAQHLSRHPVDKALERLVRETMTGLNHSDEDKRAHHWRCASQACDDLVVALQRALDDMGQGFAPMARGSRLAVALPYAEQWLPGMAFDVRRLLAVHVQGLARMQTEEAANEPKTQAFMRLAEAMLLQHSCHWYCRSKTVASARLLAQHQTRYEQVLESVHPATHTAYHKALHQIA